jgi:hypothetical protein
MPGAQKGRPHKAGAGRPPVAPGETMRPVTVWLTEAQAERLRMVGEGNASEGVRRLLERRERPDGE